MPLDVLPSRIIGLRRAFGRLVFENVRIGRRPVCEDEFAIDPTTGRLASR